MSDLSQREVNLLKILIQNETGISIDAMSKEMRISVRSVYSDIKELKEYLFAVYGIRLRKSGKLLLLDPEDRRVLSENAVDEDICSFSEKPRKYQIIEYLSDMKTTTLQEIADALYLSKSTVNQEMKAVEKLLSKFSIHIIKRPYHGIAIEGTELNIRFLLQYIISDYLAARDLNLENIVIARHFLSNDLDINIKKILEQYPQYHTTELLLCLSVMCRRIRRNHNFTASEIIHEAYENSSQLPSLRLLLNEVSKELNLTIQEDEIYYLLINMDNYDVENADEEYLHNVLEAILHLIKDKYQDIEIEVNTFYAGLMIHISTMLKRLKFGKIIRNPILDQTKEALPFAFNIAADIAIMLNTSFQIYMNEDEIGLLAMHIQAMMEESHHHRNAKYEGIVVSHIGYGNARMISGRLFARFPDLHMKHQVSYDHIEELIQEGRLENHNIIVSTCLLSLPRSRYVLVHPIITEQDILHVSEYLEQQINKTQCIVRNGFASCVPLEHIYVGKIFKNKESLLSYVCKRLYDTGYVKEDFYKSTLAREAISSTFALNGVALPHGYSKCVKKPGIAIVVLDKPLNWDGFYADMVFVCALSLNVRESDQKVFEDMYCLLNNKETLKQLKECRESKILKEILDQWNEGEKNED